MPSPGDKSPVGYGPFVRRFVWAYLFVCSALLLALLVIDTVWPGVRVYGHIKDTLLNAVHPSPARP